MPIGSCPCCARTFRSLSAKQQYERRTAILRELRGGDPASHLSPLEPITVSKIEGHRADSAYFLAHGEMQQ